MVQPGLREVPSIYGSGVANSPVWFPRFGFSLLFSSPEIYGPNGMAGLIWHVVQDNVGCFASYRVSKVEARFMSELLGRYLVPPGHLTGLYRYCCYLLCIDDEDGYSPLQVGPSRASCRRGFRFLQRSAPYGACQREYRQAERSIGVASTKSTAAPWACGLCPRWMPSLSGTRGF